MLADHAHRTGHDREVVGGAIHAPAVDEALAGDHTVGRRAVGFRGGSGHGVLVREEAELRERPCVEQQIDALACGELVPAVLLLDPLRAAHGARALPPHMQRGGQLIEPGRLRRLGHRASAPVLIRG